MTDIKLSNPITKTFNTKTNTYTKGSGNYYTEEYNIVDSGDFRQVIVNFNFTKKTGYDDGFQIIANDTDIIYDTSTLAEIIIGHSPFNLTTLPGVKYKLRFLQAVESPVALEYSLTLQDKGVAKSISSNGSEIFTINSEGSKFIVNSKGLGEIALSPDGILYSTGVSNLAQINPQFKDLGKLLVNGNSPIQGIKAIEFAKDGKLYVIGSTAESEKKTFTFYQGPFDILQINFKLQLYRIDDIQNKTATLIGDLPLDLNNSLYSTKSSNLYTLDIANNRLLTIAGDVLWQVPLFNPSLASKIGDGIGYGYQSEGNRPLTNLVFENNELIAYQEVSQPFGSGSITGNISDLIPSSQRIKIDSNTGKGTIDKSPLVKSTLSQTSIIPDSLLNITPTVLPNHAPTLASPISDTTAPVNSPFNFTVPVNTFIDSDVGDKLTYKATLDDGNQLPSWLKFDANTRTFSGTPSTSDVSNVSVKVTASDPQQLAVSDTFNINVVKSVIRIKGVQFSEEFVNKSLGVKNNIQQTVDGNIVSIEATIENLGDVDKFITVSAKDTEQGLSLGKQTIKIAARSTVPTKEIKWDTNGYAWDSGKPSDRKIVITTEDSSNPGNNQTSAPQGIKVIPKPVILVHGLNSSAEVFNNYVNFLKSTNPEWKGVKAAKIDTGIFTPDLTKGEILDPTVSSIIENARQLDIDIEAARYNLNAQHVDIVAHSMGGLISRQYIQDFMAPSIIGSPVVSNLLMMGTPNGGSEVGSLGDFLLKGPAISLALATNLLPESQSPSFLRQLTTDYVRNIFNKEVKDTKGVSFSVLSGNIKPTIGSLAPLIPIVPLLPDSDGFVTVASSEALGLGAKNQQILPLGHFSLPTDQGAFNQFVLPRLTKDPIALGKSSSLAPLAATVSTLSLETAPATAQAIQPIKPSLQAFFGGYPEVPATGSVEVNISVPTGSKLEIDYIGANSVSAILIDPNGKTVQTIPAGTLRQGEFFRGFEVISPIVGNYKLRLEQQQGVKSNVQIAAGIVGSPISLDIAVTDPDLNKQSQITATIANGTAPIIGATVKGTISSSDGSTKILTLLDDGKHGDGIAGDGVYGIKTDTLFPDDYLIGIAAQGQDFSRFASKNILVSGGNKANVFIKQTSLVDSGIVGKSATYTFEVGDIGPSKATGVTLVDTLSADVDFVSASPGATFDPSSRKVTFNLGEIASQSIVNAKLVVNRKKTGAIGNLAVVRANEFDINLDDNQIIAAGTVANNAPTVNTPLANVSATQDKAFTLTIPTTTFKDLDSGDILTYTATLGNGNPLPTWLKFNSATGTFTGTPTNTDLGSLQVKVTASDKSSAAIFSTFALDILSPVIVNNAPVASKPLANASATQDKPFTLALPVGAFTDPDAGDVLTYSATLNGATLPTWLKLDAATGTFTGTPTSTNLGSFQVKVTATDKARATVSSNFALDVLVPPNNTPIASKPLVNASAIQDKPFTLALPVGAFTDPDAGDVLTYSATLNGATLPTWLKLDAATGTFTGTPTSTNLGSFQVKVTATDKARATVSSNFTLDVLAPVIVNQAPVVSKPLVNTTATQDNPFTLALPVGAFTDPDVGDVLTYSATANGAALPAWLKLDAATGKFTGTPTNTNLGSLQVKVTATDKAQATANSTFALDVVGNPVIPIQPLTLQKSTNSDVWNVNGSGQIKVSLLSKNTTQLNEIGIFKVDDSNRLNGIAPGAAGFAKAAIESSSVIFSTLPGSITDGLTLSNSLRVNNGERLGFFLVANGSVEEDLKTNNFSNITTSADLVNPYTTSPAQVPLQVKENQGAYTLDWKQGDKNLSFNFQVDPTPETALTSISSQQGQKEGEMLDLRGFSGQNVQATFTMKREAGYNDSVSFYKIDDTAGTITSSNGQKFQPRDSGYVQAALNNAISGLNLAGKNGETVTVDRVLQGGSLYAPILMSNVTSSQPTGDNAFTAFSLGNADRTDHVRLLGGNTFGFEDLFGGGDKDFNDVIVQATFKTI